MAGPRDTAAAAAAAIAGTLARLPLVRPDDGELVRRVEQALAAEPAVPAEAIRVRADAGAVTLEGDLGSPYTQATLDAAAHAARSVRGVRSVASRLRLTAMTPEQVDELR